MKYFLYIERGIGEFPHEEIFPLKAETLFNALLEADRHYDKDTVFLLKIYEQVDSYIDGNVQTNLFMPRLEKRCEQWSRYREEYSKQNVVRYRRADK
jgi:hypothetical protein